MLVSFLSKIFTNHHLIGTLPLFSVEKKINDPCCGAEPIFLGLISIDHAWPYKSLETISLDNKPGARQGTQMEIHHGKYIVEVPNGIETLKFGASRVHLKMAQQNIVNGVTEFNPSAIL